MSHALFLIGGILLGYCMCVAGTSDGLLGWPFAAGAFLCVGAWAEAADQYYANRPALKSWRAAR